MSEPLLPEYNGGPYVTITNWGRKRLHLHDPSEGASTFGQYRSICSPYTWGLPLEAFRQLALPMCQHCRRKAALESDVAALGGAS